MVSLNLRKFNKRIKHIKFGPYYMVALNKWDKGEQLFTFIDGKTYRDSEAHARCCRPNRTVGGEAFFDAKKLQTANGV